MSHWVSERVGGCMDGVSTYTEESQELTTATGDRKRNDFNLHRHFDSSQINQPISEKELFYFFILKPELYPSLKAIF